MSQCWMLQFPEVTVVYVYPVVGEPYESNASRFFDTYQKHPAGYPHKLYVVSNGGTPRPAARRHLAGAPHTVLLHDNSGWDIGAFQKASRAITCDLMLFLGSSSYFNRAGWLERMVEAQQKHGFELYGSMATGASPEIGVWEHIRTTGFWCDPLLLANYPVTVKTGERTDRYAFEHGKSGFTRWSKEQGVRPIMVTWNGEYEEGDWSKAVNGYHNGDQSAILVRDRNCDPPFWP